MLYVQRPNHPFAAFYSEPEYPRARPQRPAPETSYGYERATSSEETYRQIAEEYQRKANIAKALATQEHQRALERERSAKAAQLQRIRYQIQQRREAERQAELRRALQARSAASCCAPRQQFAPRQAEPTHPFEAFLAQLLGGAMNTSEEQAAASSDEKKVCHCQAPCGDKQDRSSSRRQVRFNFQPSSEPAPAKGKGKERDVGPAEAAAPQEQPSDSWSQVWNLLSDAAPAQQERMLQELGFLSPRPQAANLNGPRRQAATIPVPVAGPSGVKRAEVPAPKAAPASAPVSPKSPGSDRFAPLTSIDTVETKFIALKAQFEFPSSLDFDTTSSDAKLLHTPKNAPFHQYESDLVKLMTKLDAIESDGAESIRGARKALVHAIEAELDRIDGLKAEAWKVQTPIPEKEEAVVAEPASENTLELDLPKDLDAVLAVEPAATEPHSEATSTTVLESAPVAEVAQEVKGYEVSFPEVVKESVAAPVEEAEKPVVEEASDVSAGAVIALDETTDEEATQAESNQHDEPTSDHDDLADSVLVEEEDAHPAPISKADPIHRPASPGSEGEFEML